jgi:thiamine-phosphate pyrophosphorylase
MMLPEMTPAVARALESAQVHALRSGFPEILPVHVLHGLLEEEEGRATLLAISARLDYPAYRQSLPSGEAPVAAEPLPFHRVTMAAFRQARELATDLVGESVVGSESLLLALLGGDLSAREHLEEFGLEFTVLEANLLARKPPPLKLEEPLHLEPWTEVVDLGRIVDACANRAREGLRVVEDYCRFVLDDTFLSSQLKQLRHDLSAALSSFPAELLLQARETQHDVGTASSTVSETRRQSLLEVAQVNWKRLQEALRSLEEYAKVPLAGGGPDLGAGLEALRYRTYTLERAIVLGTASRERLAGAQLYVILSASQCFGSLERTIKEAAAGGAAVIQLREKNLADRDLWQQARQACLWAREAGVVFILNDRPDIARLVEADGVHLGQDDLQVKEARRILGPDAFIGVSTHNLEQVWQAVLDGASYIGVGAVFPTTTKQVPGYAGLEFVREALAETTLPAFAIGGVNLKTIDQLAAIGATRVAVSSAIAGAEDPQAMARALLQALPERKPKCQPARNNTPSKPEP